MKNFYIAAKSIHQLHLSSNAIVVYYDLCRRADKEDTCWPNKRTVAEACSISVSTVTRALRELEKAGMIVTVERFEEKKDHYHTYKRQTSNRYKVFATPQKFTKSQETSNQSADEKPQQEVLEVAPALAEQEICEEDNQSTEALPEIAPESILSLPENEPQNYPLEDKSSSDKPAEKKQAELNNDSRKSVPALPFMGLLCFLFTFFDTPPHVSVTRHGTTSLMKVTDNLRVKSIFSKLAKRSIGRLPYFFAGLGKCLSKNE